MKQGKLYGVSVGPGDPELMTLKAVRAIQEADVLAVPNIGHKRQTALSIAEEYTDGKLQIRPCRPADCPAECRRAQPDGLICCRIGGQVLRVDAVRVDCESADRGPVCVQIFTV